MSRERIKKLKAVIKRLEAAIEPVNPVLAICKDETEEEVLKKYGFTTKDRDRIQWVRVFGSKKNGGPEDPVRPLSSNSDRLKELEQQINDAVKDLKSDGFTEEQIEILVTAPIVGPRFIYREKKNSVQENSLPSLLVSTTKKESNRLKTEDPEEPSDLVKLMAGRKPSKKISIDEG